MEEEKMQIRRGALDQTARPQKGKKKKWKEQMCFTERQQGNTGKERNMESKGLRRQLSSKGSPLKKNEFVEVSAVWTEPEGQELFKETKT